MSKVIKLEDILQSEEVQNVSKLSKEKPLNIPRGVPKSGRIWKNNKDRFKSIVKTGGIKKSNAFVKQMKLRDDLKRVKSISRARAQERDLLKEQKKERRRRNIEKQKENQQKSEVVQIIKNPNKIKKMRRKQLRSIEKRDTTKISR